MSPLERVNVRGAGLSRPAAATTPGGHLPFCPTDPMRLRPDALTRSSGLNCVIDPVEGGGGEVYVVLAGDLGVTGDVGVTVTACETLDQTRSQATVSFADAAGLAVGAEAGRAEDLLRVMLAVESAAAAEYCLDVTVGYLKTRKQFGRALGTFQALRHRCADLAVEVASAVATARAAIARPDEVAVLGPLAKKHCADVFWHVAAEMVQLHGGIGFTWEHESHRYLKRAKTTQLLHGSPAELRRLVAQRAALHEELCPVTATCVTEFFWRATLSGMACRRPVHWCRVNPVKRPACETAA